MKVDALVDLQFGDSGKGKISKVLNEQNNYSAIIKFNGSGNAGHAVWIGDKKYIAHYLTSGIYNKETKIVVGPGCVINSKEFIKEYELFNKEFSLDGRVFIHPYTHIITQEHINIDLKEDKIGTTNKGNGPCYSDKYKRVGLRTDSVKELEKFILPEKMVKDIMKIRPKVTSSQGRILMEGSQGWYLDIDHGNYPYVTSSHIHPGFAFTSFGIPLQLIGDVYGVCKIYETYVGNGENIVISSKEDEEMIRDVGKEYGETTGRPRKIGYLNIQRLIDAANHCGVNILYINKIDVLRKLNIFKIIDLENNIKIFENFYDMTEYIKEQLMLNVRFLMKIKFSGEKDGSDLKSKISEQWDL